MHYIRRAEARGRTEFGGWLKSRHSFSFGSYHDPDHMGFSALRVINDDEVAPGSGFDAHGHRDMEIISYVLDGALKHEDSAGGQHLVPAGEVQLMSAGSGVIHSEYNDSDDAPVRFLQIWIEPAVRGTAPEYVQRKIPQSGPLTPLVTPDGRGETLSIGQNASISRLVLAEGEEWVLPSIPQKTYLHVIEGSLAFADDVLAPGDAVALGEHSAGIVRALQTVHALFFELPA